MNFASRACFRLTALLLVAAVLALTTPMAEAKPITPIQVHQRILKRGIGSWVGVELLNGTAVVGRLVSIDDDSFGLQLRNDPEVTPIRYEDVVKLHFGITSGTFWAITAAGVAGTVAMALVAHNAITNERDHPPTLPAESAGKRLR